MAVVLEHQLTPKMRAFARYVASGMSYAAAYRKAYNIVSTRLSTQSDNASRLARDTRVAALIERLIVEREKDALAHVHDDRETARQLFRDAATGRLDVDPVQLKAAELLMKSAGGFDSNQMTPSRDESAAEVMEDITAHLDKLLNAAGAVTIDASDID
jgi:hypothetical protein